MRYPIALAALVLTTGLLAATTACTSGGPDGAPDEIRVVDGERGNVSEDGDSRRSFSVAVESREKQDEAVELLQNGGGFTLVGEGENDGERRYALSNGQVNVTLLLTEMDGAPIVIYNILNLD